MRSLKRKRNKNPMGKIGNVFYFILFHFISFALENTKTEKKTKNNNNNNNKNTVDVQTKY